MITEAVFQLGLDDRPDDCALRLVFSDWLEEEGRGDEAAAQRWMAENSRRPIYSPSTDTWDWWPDRIARNFRDKSSVGGVPDELHTMFRGMSKQSPMNGPVVVSWVGYPTRQDAERALADVLARAAEHAT
jgi:uncharacterized protein (TIGR02996 family)